MSNNFSKIQLKKVFSSRKALILRLFLRLGKAQGLSAGVSRGPFLSRSINQKEIKIKGLYPLSVSEAEYSITIRL